MIYLDHNATTAIDPDVAAVVYEEMLRGAANPASQHAIGRAARGRMDEAVESIGALIGSDLTQPGGPRLIITSGGTESNHLALHGIGDPSAPLITSSIEHSSVLAAAKSMADRREICVLPADRDGVIDLEELGA